MNLLAIGAPDPYFSDPAISMTDPEISDPAGFNSQLFYLLEICIHVGSLVIHILCKCHLFCLLKNYCARKV